MRTSIAILFALGVFSCGEPHEDRSEKLSIPGEESSMAVIVGQGLNHIDWTPKGHCVNIEGLRTQSGQSTGQFVEFRLLEVTSISSLRESLDISASASIRAGLFGRLSARMNYVQSVNKNSSSRYLMVHTRVGNQLQLAMNFTFTSEAQNLLHLDQQKEFVKNCGTEFVYGYRTGGEFFALFEFEFAQSEEEKRFSAAIQAAGTGWRVSSDINSELSKFDQNARVQLSMYRVGGSGALPEVNDLKEFANQFPTLVSQSSQGFVTLELVTKDYTGVRPIDIRVNQALTIRQDQVVNQLARNRDSAQELLNSIHYVKMHLGDFAVDDRAGKTLNEGELLVLTYLNEQNDAAVNCFEDIFNGCKLPTGILPGVQLPLRRSSAEQNCRPGYSWSELDAKCCRLELETICQLQGSDNACVISSTRRVKVCQ